jgi:hypothetical protein
MHYHTALLPAMTTQEKAQQHAGAMNVTFVTER